MWNAKTPIVFDMFRREVVEKGKGYKLEKA
jgi:hypothetical protein